MAAIGVGAGSGELLLLSGGDGGIRRGHGDRHQSGRCYGQAGRAADGTRCGLNDSATGGECGRQPTGADGGDGWGARGPGGGSGEVLMAAVSVGAGGSELLLLSGGDGGIRRGHGDRHQGGRCNGQAGRAADGTRCGLNDSAAGGECGRQPTSTDGRDGGGTRGPGGGSGEVLMAAVGVGAGGSELLLLTGGEGGIHRGHGDGDQGGRGHRQAGGAADRTRRGLNRSRACGYRSGQTAAADGGDGSGAGGPSGGGGEVLMTAVAVGAGGGELLRLTGGDRRIGRGDGDGDQHGRGHGQAGGADDGA